MQYFEENALLIYSHSSNDEFGAWNDIRSGDTYESWGSYIVEYTPEPTTFLLLTLGGLLLKRRNQK
ncbi:MAG: PEP-CTERM sorting domain-containing protein [Phycisphaerales bacterium]|jgi:hypothetical protein